MSPIRILIVDDHEVVRIGLRTLLSRFPHLEVVGEGNSVNSAVERSAELKPDLVLLDVRLGDENGFDACKRLQKLDVSPKVLILTSFADDDMVFKSIAAGADGYVLKEIDGDGLVRAIEKVAAGQSILDPAVTAQVFGRVKRLAEPSRGKMEILSAQEKRVLALVAEGKTNKEIAVVLGLSDKTVKNYLSNILEKLQFSRRSQAAAFYVQNALPV